MRVPLTAAALALVAFLGCLAGSLLWRAHVYQARGEANKRSAAAIHERLLPGEPVPVGVRRRLESAHARLLGTSGRSATTPSGASALRTLHDLLRRMPDDLRLSILEVRVDDDRVRLAGRARSHADADRVASSLRGDGRFVVEPPRTETSRQKGVSFTLAALASRGAPTEPKIAASAQAAAAPEATP